MRSSLKGRPSASMLILVMGVGLMPASCMPAAAPTQELPSYCYDETKFGDELVACVRRSSTRAASDACRAEVHSSCGYKVGAR